MIKPATRTVEIDQDRLAVKKQLIMAKHYEIFKILLFPRGKKKHFEKCQQTAEIS